MKKYLSVFMALICFISVLSMPVSAEQTVPNIIIEFHSDIGGLTYEDADKIAVIKSDGIVCDNLQINDYAGNVYLDKMKPGRTYTFTYSFKADKGFELPDELSENNVSFICNEHSTVWWYGKTVGAYVDGKRQCYLSVSAEITVDGNLFRRIFGRIADFFQKLCAWSPY